MTEQRYIYKRFERFWHWAQAFLILFLALTGFEIHGSYSLFGFEKAVFFHTRSAFALLVLVGFAIFWHLTTGEWRQYIPTLDKLVAQVRFYAYGMFKGEPHPYHKTELGKLNPLQRLVYLKLKLVLIPLVALTGLPYMYHRLPGSDGSPLVLPLDLGLIAFLHTMGAYALVLFLIVHVYMTTTGATPLANLRAMITGYEDLEPEEETHG